MFPPEISVYHVELHKFRITNSSHKVTSLGDWFLNSFQYSAEFIWRKTQYWKYELSGARWSETTSCTDGSVWVFKSNAPQIFNLCFGNIKRDFHKQFDIQYQLHDILEYFLYSAFCLHFSEVRSSLFLSSFSGAMLSFCWILLHNSGIISKIN